MALPIGPTEKEKVLMPGPGGHATEIAAKGRVSRIASSSSPIGCFERAVRVITETEVHVHELGVGNVGERTEGGEGTRMHPYASPQFGMDA